MLEIFRFQSGRTITSIAIATTVLEEIAADGLVRELIVLLTMAISQEDGAEDAEEKDEKNKIPTTSKTDFAPDRKTHSTRKL